MVGSDEIEQLILARCDLAVRALALAEGAIARMCHDPDLAVRLRGFLEGVRREMSAFALRVEAVGGYRSEEDVGAVMEAEFAPVESALTATLATIDRKLGLGVPVGRA
jgi:hypothetical protein